MVIAKSVNCIVLEIKMESKLAKFSKREIAQSLLDSISVNFGEHGLQCMRSSLSGYFKLVYCFDNF